MIFATVPALAVPARADRDVIAHLPQTLMTHDAHLARHPGMTQTDGTLARRTVRNDPAR